MEEGLIDQTVLKQNIRIALYEGGIIRIFPGNRQEIKIDAADATLLLDFLLLHGERLHRWAREMNKSSVSPPGPAPVSEE